MPTTLRSFSKINLGLAIGPVRRDGFHPLTTCYQTLEAHDRVTVEARPAGETALRITCTAARVPTDARNTAWKMTEHVLGAMGISAAVHIHIEKRLPIQGGLGAGSANAAAALLGLEAELAGHGIASLPGPEKLRLAGEAGSDVPLFLIGGAILGLGRGEQVYPLPDLLPTQCVLALPEIGVSTPQAFRDWDAGHPGSPGCGEGPELTAGDGSDRLTRLSRALASSFGPGEPVLAGQGAHSSGVSAKGEDLAGKTGPPQRLGGGLDPLLALVRTGIENDFEEVVFRQHPSLGTIKRVLAAPQDSAEALYAGLSGSGSALFGLYGTESAAEAAVAQLGVLGVRCLRTKTLPRAEYWQSMMERTQ